MEVKNALKSASRNTSGNASKSAAGRLRFVDIAKGISIICIILGHLGIHNITRVVFTFHVPIFFVAAGMLSDRLFSKCAGVRELIRHDENDVLPAGRNEPPELFV